MIPNSKGRNVVIKNIPCDYSLCNKQAVWYAYLDAVSFCLKHKKEWVNEKRGYEDEPEFSL